MAITGTELKALLQSAFVDADIIIEDTQGDNNHYGVHIKSSLFKGKSRLEQHKMVYAALGDLMQDRLHALSLKTSEK